MNDWTHIEESKHQRDQRDDKSDCDAIFNDSQSVRTYSIKICEDEFTIITSENSETSEIWLDSDALTKTFECLLNDCEISKY